MKVKCNHCEKELTFQYDNHGFIINPSENGWALAYTLNYNFKNKKYLDLCPNCLKELREKITQKENEIISIYNDFVDSCDGTSTQIIEIDTNKIYEAVKKRREILSKV